MYKKVAAAALIAGLMCGCGGKKEIAIEPTHRTIILEANQKVEKVYWQADDTFCYLTRPMKQDEKTEILRYMQTVDGNTVTIVETKLVRGENNE